MIKFNMSRMKPALVLILLAMLVVSTACSGGEAPSPSPTPSPAPAPGGNQAPAISSLSAPQTEVYPSTVVTEIRCDASDPDGDAITYDWSATGGSFTGSGTVVSWVAPESYGDYTITVSIRDGKGGITEASMTMSVVSNRDPVISSLTADPTTVLPGDKSTITCAASDEDGDVLNYSWEASDGSITGTGNTITWIAPDREDEFSIAVTVDDGKGGQGGDVVVVTVLFAEKTATFNPLAVESGTASSKGDKDTSKTKAGDDDDNIAYRAFWSFDLYSLRNTMVKDAKLTFVIKGEVAGKPFDKITGLGGLHIYEVRYDPGQLPDYSIDAYSELTPVMWELPTEVDVTAEVSKIGQGLSTNDRLQIELKHLDGTNGNSFADYVEWSRVTLTVTYTEK